MSWSQFIVFEKIEALTVFMSTVKAARVNLSILNCIVLNLFISTGPGVYAGMHLYSIGLLHINTHLYVVM